MIERIIVVDPKPRPCAKSDVLVYQVPEKSREAELLMTLLSNAGVEFIEFESTRAKKKEKR